MKNLLIYIHPRKDFDDEGKVAIKIQIDNSLDLGWKREDIILLTNFPYEYRRIKSLVVPDDNYCSFFPQAGKNIPIIYLFEKGFVKNGELWWSHDLDAFQLCEITESDLEVGNETDILLPVGHSPIWSTGSFFFKNSSRDISSSRYHF